MNTAENQIIESPRLSRYIQAVESCKPIRRCGRVSQVVGVLIESNGPMMTIGDVGWIHSRDGKHRVLAEVVGLRGNKILLMPFGPITGISIESEVIACHEPVSTYAGFGLLGRVLDGLGRPRDGKGLVRDRQKKAIHNDPPDPLIRQRIKNPIATGIRAIDGMVTIGEGQRMGIFAGSGVGKSVLLGMIARNTEADVNVIALIGERGREVREFIERDLGTEGLKRSVIVVVTSDEAAILRIKGAMVATTIAEFFRDQGLRVMLMMDSVTRFAMAQREIGLAVGEPPTTKGYTPSVFMLLPKLLERAGMGEKGSITGLYTVLVESDDMNEPVADTVRSILDGHIVLSRKLASLNHYPAIDILESVSRVMKDIIPNEHERSSAWLNEMLATYKESEDLINIGAYVKGSSKKIDMAITANNKINEYLRQGMYDQATWDDAVDQLKILAGENDMAGA